jgi:REP element-mobilizing transposase RayT
MTRPRAQLVSLEATPYYHCIARCVRRAWLCGTDRYSGKNFDHRKQWLLDRLTLLGDVFAIDIAAYAIMSNHYHVVLHVDTDRGSKRTDAEVIRQWTRLYTGPELIRRHLAGTPLLEAEQTLVRQIVQRWRERLCNISWFMRCLNEYLARRANAEDGCKGRFWEARFRSQALLDEAALLSCMAYVDLNPIRAGIAHRLEESDFTSVQDRINQTLATRDAQRHKNPHLAKPRLMPFTESLSERQAFAGIPFNLWDYLELVDWTGRAVRQDKKGFIPESAPRVLHQIGLSEVEWQFLALDIQKRSITMLQGLAQVVAWKQRAPIQQAA